MMNGLAPITTMNMIVLTPHATNCSGPRPRLSWKRRMNATISTKLAMIHAKNVRIGISGRMIVSSTDRNSHSCPVRMRFVICSPKLGAAGFGGITGTGCGVAVGFAGYWFSNCCRMGAGLPSRGGMKGESGLIPMIRSFAVTGCPFIVPIGVCPSTRGGRGRGGR